MDRPITVHVAYFEDLFQLELCLICAERVSITQQINAERFSIISETSSLHGFLFMMIFVQNNSWLSNVAS